MRKTACVVGLMVASIVLTGCGEDKPKTPEFHVKPPSKATLTKLHKQEWERDWFEPRIVDVWPMGYWNDLSDETQEKISDTAFKVCRHIRNDDDWDEDRAEAYTLDVLNSMESLDEYPGNREDAAYRIVYQAAAWADYLSELTC
ncbi:hypothetical protein SEA_CIRCINUS_231 [Streptomyces phage Circinus]|uniref:Lipoprotein n=1 Tax=Streptomyces phage Circinus TaxID=2562189 RepID=A0A4D6E1U9_9CAUD|nr:hypothetical protein SEA_CIRCINUS_231 [Streptomyces phage Circinus]